MASDMPTNEMPKTFNIRVLSDGKYVLSCGPNDEYAYDTVDELISGLKSELGNDSEDTSSEPDAEAKKKNVKKMMEGDSNE